MKYKIGTQAKIEAPLQLVWDTLTDFNTYQSWNPKSSKITVKTAARTGHFIIRRIKLKGIPFPMKSKITACQPPYRIVWASNWGLIRYRRSQTIKWIDDQHTQYLTMVKISGILAPLLIGKLRKKIRRNHEYQIHGLQTFFAKQKKQEIISV